MKKNKREVLYAGNDDNVAKTMRTICGSKYEFRQITNFRNLKSYLRTQAGIFDYGCQAGIKFESAYPIAMFVIPDLYKSKNVKETTPAGPALVQTCVDNLDFVHAYVLAEDKAYNENRKNLVTCCKKHGTPIIKESELEKTLKKILK